MTGRPSRGREEGLQRVVEMVVKVAAFGGLVLSAFHALAHLVIVATHEGGLYLCLTDRAGGSNRLDDLSRVTQLMGQS